MPRGREPARHANPAAPRRRLSARRQPGERELAARLDWNFVFAAHLNGDKTLLREVLTRWRALSRRDAIVAIQVIVAEERATAIELAQQVEVWGVELENGQRVTVGSEAQAAAFARQAGSPPVRIARRDASLLAGTADEVKAQLDALHALAY
jgi:alkanesulfonate monooxygenase SsuD/methylene tetrahydromethanopterin reductase-like flavin-dependent oxidoreductase (luciferase family)